MSTQTDSSFDERVYLAANPDVANAVSKGEFASGREHFNIAGQKEGRIANAQQFILYQARKSAIHQQQLKALQSLSDELRNEIDALRLSTSWRITKPLRALSRFIQRFIRLIRLFRNYRIKHPGIGGLARLAKLSIESLRYGGIKNLRSRVAIHERVQSARKQPPFHPVLILEDLAEKSLTLPKDVAVHVHMFYPDLAPEIRSYLVNIPTKFHLYVTTDTLEKAKVIEEILSNLDNIKALDIHVTENRGRDIFPMLVSLGRELAEHEVVLHIHTKRSPHNTWVLGGWRRYMMESLLGNPRRISAILRQFVNNENLGILFPDPYHLVKPFVHMLSNANDHNMEKLLGMAGKGKSELGKIDRTFFPAGDMFWFRGEAIRPFVDMKLSAQDFEPEAGQVDETLAHAIERMFPYFASEKGLTTQSFFSNAFLSQQCSAHQFDLFYSYTAKGLIRNCVLLFDHNLGGGANIYTRELVGTILENNGAVLRVYNLDGNWFVQWIAEGDGMLFYTPSIEELFKALSLSRCTSVTVNSIYGCPDIKNVILKILGLIREQKIALDFKVHDFLALCPSPHLSNFKEEYCGVPQNRTACQDCLKNNTSWYVGWYPEKNRPITIEEWRKPFANLIDGATTITFFDNSSIEIFRRGYSLDDSKIRVVPHEVNYFKCDQQMDLSGRLHVGILGTLTKIKGGKVVHALSDYIEEQGLQVPITVVGPDHVDTPPHINVHGPYEPNHLPAIIGNNGINVILAPSIVPETFGYTISEAMKMGLPIVAFDLGAQGSRIKQYELGKVVPLGSSPEEILNAIQSVHIAAKERK